MILFILSIFSIFSFAGRETSKFWGYNLSLASTGELFEALG